MQPQLHPRLTILGPNVRTNGGLMSDTSGLNTELISASGGGRDQNGGVNECRLAPKVHGCECRVVAKWVQPPKGGGNGTDMGKTTDKGKVGKR